MNRRRLKLVLAIGVMSLLGAVGVAVATGGNSYREHLTGYKCPRDVEFRGELPKSNVGKILRRELRDEARRVA